MAENGSNYRDKEQRIKIYYLCICVCQSVELCHDSHVQPEDVSPTIISLPFHRASGGQHP